MQKITLMTVLILTIIGLIIGCATAGFLNDRTLGGEDYRSKVDWITAGENKRADFTHGPGNYGRKLEYQGISRFYEIYVPPAYDKTKPLPVVMVFHGGLGYPGIVRFETGMDRTAERNGFIAVYPAGTPSTRLANDRLLVWNDGRPSKGRIKMGDDVGFVVAVLDDLSNLFNIDKNRIYATGFSNGGLFSCRLAQELSHKIAAIAPISGLRGPGETLPPPPRAVSIMAFQGKQDIYYPYEGGTPHRTNFETRFKPVMEEITAWARFNGCASKPSERKIGRANELRWKNCRGGTEVVLWTLEDGGHSYPGGNLSPSSVKNQQGNINRDISASDLVWDFFKRHSLQEGR
jgi:polyhydroxybutyrate depolymerase